MSRLKTALGRQDETLRYPAGHIGRKGNVKIGRPEGRTWEEELERLMHIALGQEKTQQKPIEKELTEGIPGVSVIAKSKSRTDGAGKGKTLEVELRGEAWRTNRLKRTGRLRVHLGKGVYQQSKLQQALEKVGQRFQRRVDKWRRGVDEAPIDTPELQ